MVSPALLDTLGRLSDAERIELRDYLDSTIVPVGISLTEDQQRIIRRRDADLDADPGLALPAREVVAELRADIRRRRQTA
jgi:putative addiction module component (TIGR02574 family)